MIKNLLKKEKPEVSFLHELLKNDFSSKILDKLINDGSVNINHQDQNADTFIIKCIKIGKVNAAIWLMEKGIDLSLRNRDNKTVIDIAMEQDSIQFVQHLIKKDKINLSDLDKDQRSYLQNVVVLGYHELSKVLVSGDINVNNLDNKKRNVIYDALSFGDRAFIHYLLELKTIDLNNYDIDGNTIMQHPQVLKNDEIAKDLIKFGADPSLKPTKGESYLLRKALQGEEAEEIIDLALEHGTNVNSKTANENTILMELLAVATTNKDLRKSLIGTTKKMVTHGGDINFLDENNETALFNAIRLQDTDLIGFLLSAGTDPNVVNNKGETVLSEILYEGQNVLDIILMLLNYGANPCFRNSDGKNLLEILNELTLHNYGTKLTEDPILLKKIKANGSYIIILKEFLKRIDLGQEDDFFNVNGDPLFFDPLIYNHFILFKLYLNSGLDINMVNEQNHNIFYEYVLHKFQDNDDSPKILEYFQTSLSSLVSQKVDRNYQDMLGWTVLHKIVTNTECNEKLFDILIKIVKFDYSVTDNLGRTIIHNCVWGNKINIIKRMADTSLKAIINQTDGYGILPITYAALLGNTQLVLLFIKLQSDIQGSKKIPPNAIKKFSPMLKNLPKLKTDIEDPTELKNLDIVISQVESDFKN